MFSSARRSFISQLASCNHLKSVPHSSPRSALSSYGRRNLSTSTRINMPRTAETSSFRFNHTMLRVKDPKASVKFYTEILGMSLVDTHVSTDFTLYFLAFDAHDNVADEERKGTRLQREGILELTHNHGTEDLAETPYHNGNSEPRGFGHIALTVDDIDAACERFEKLGVQFKKRPQDGKMRHIAFILDPDNYWIEILPNKPKQY